MRVYDRNVLPHFMLHLAFTLHVITFALSILDVLVFTHLMGSIFWTIIFGILIFYDIIWLLIYAFEEDMSIHTLKQYRLYIYSFIALNFLSGIIVFSTGFVNLQSEPYESNSVRFKEYLSIYPILSMPVLFIFFPTVARIRGYLD
jgi:hypothetical protein